MPSLARVRAPRTVDRRPGFHARQKLLWLAPVTDANPIHGVYGAPPPALAEPPPGARQHSPFVPGSFAIETASDDAFAGFVMLAPPGAAERRFVLAHALRALAPGASLIALAPKAQGGARLRAELEAFGCTVAERSKAHHRICETVRPFELDGIEAAIEAGAPRLDPTLGLWTQPGVFAFDRIDAGTALLIEHLPPFSGQGADLGSGLGVLSRAVLASPSIAALHLVEIDRRAVEAARRNLPDARAVHHWADARTVGLGGLDFVVSNPPFHVEGVESRALGQDFVRSSAAMLRRGGRLRLVANRHLPYEAVLRERFARVETVAEGSGYKIFEAVK